jgi:3-oxoacyl-[acyl-carrier-protein] synthase-3
VLFGDGAGAVVLEAQELTGGKEDRGILTSYLRSDGRHRDKLYVDGGPSCTQTVGHCAWTAARSSAMRSARSRRAIEGALARSGFSAEDIDWFVPHQANKRIIDGRRPQARSSAERSCSRSIGMATPRPPSIPLALRRCGRGIGESSGADSDSLEAMGAAFTHKNLGRLGLVRW